MPSKLTPQDRDDARYVLAILKATSGLQAGPRAGVARDVLRAAIEEVWEKPREPGRRK